MPVQLHFFGISSVGIGNEMVKTAASCLHRKKKNQRRVLVETVRPTPLGESKNINRSQGAGCTFSFQALPPPELFSFESIHCTRSLFFLRE